MSKVFNSLIRSKNKFECNLETQISAMAMTMLENDFAVYILRFSYNSNDDI